MIPLGHRISSNLICLSLPIRSALATDHRVLLMSGFTDHPELCAYSISIALGTNGVDQQPVISISTLVVKNHGLVVVAIYSDIHKAVVVQISERDATGRQRNVESSATLIRHVLELAL